MPRQRVRRGQHPKSSTRPKKENPTADEFTEHDLDTPTEADLDLAYGSQYLSANDVGDRKIRTKIAKVRKADMRGNDDKKRMKFILYLESLDKPMVLNATNKNALVDKLGRAPTNWIGATIGLYVDPNVSYAGKLTKGLRLRVLGPAVTAAPKPTPAPKPAPAATSATPEWPEENGDPGPEFSDDIPDFSTAAA
jgi:hypothetical protein